MSGKGKQALHKAYWKGALWLTAGITLVALVGINTYIISAKVEHLAVGVAFSLLTGLLKRETARGSITLAPFLTYATARLLAALAVIGAFMALSGLRGRELLPFVIVFSIYFILTDALDALFMVKAVRGANKEA